MTLEPGALSAEALFTLAYNNLHPLWIACHWENATFTKLPFSLLWNTGEGLIARSFSVTPIAFIPTVEMAQVTGVIDVMVPALCSNPFWASDYLDCPVVGVEPLHCYYPPFTNLPASVDGVRQWARASLHPSQLQFLKRPFFYPQKDALSAERKLSASNKIIEELGF